MDNETRELPEATSQPCWLVTRFEAMDVQAAAEVRSILDGARSTVDAETGVKQYAVLSDIDHPTSTWVIEEWATRADAERHEAAAGAGEGAHRLQSLLARPYTPSRLMATTEAAATTQRERTS